MCNSILYDVLKGLCNVLSLSSEHVFKFVSNHNNISLHKVIQSSCTTPKESALEIILSRECK
jgi:hypothetical protein